jgi:hypothetical protein
MRITFAFKNKVGFFTPEVIERALNKARILRLLEAGAFVRTKASQSMKRPGKKKQYQPSAPGRPPNAHTAKGTLGLKTILFGYDQQSDGVIVGPIKFNTSVDGVRASTTVPALHEYGQTAIITERRWMPSKSWQKPGPWIQVHGKTKSRPGARYEYRRRTAKYPPRPFMAPALAAEAPKFPDLFENSMK